VVKIAATSTESMSDVVTKFLVSPPDDTPSEVVEALTFHRSRRSLGLPRPVFVELLERAPVAVTIADPETKILYANQAYASLTGYSQDEILGKPQSAFTSPATPEAVLADLGAAIKTGRAWSGALVNRRKASGDYLGSLTVAPVRDSRGDLAYLLAMHRDISREHHHHWRVRHQKALVESVLDAAPVAVALLDAGGSVVLDNQEYKKLLGDLKGQEPADLLLQALSREFGLDLALCRDTGAAFRGREICLGGARGQPHRWFCCSGTWLADLAPPVQEAPSQRRPSEGCLLLLAEEITEKRRGAAPAPTPTGLGTVTQQGMGSVQTEALASAAVRLRQPIDALQAAREMIQEGKAGQAGSALLLLRMVASAQQALEALRNDLRGYPGAQETSIPGSETRH
jgi:nitrogen fixation negative regulator NifL